MAELAANPAWKEFIAYFVSRKERQINTLAYTTKSEVDHAREQGRLLEIDEVITYFDKLVRP